MKWTHGRGYAHVEALVERAVAGITITEITPQADNDALDDLIDDLL